VISGPDAFVVVAKDFSDFEHAISRKLLREIANAGPEDGEGHTGPKRTAAAAR
jgi:hypothetical protein